MSSKKIYLVAYYYMKPKHQRVRTETAGWMKDQDNITWDEQIAITKKLKDRDISSAKIILDLTDRKVVINGWTGNRDFDELFSHYYKHYRRDLHPVAEQLGYFQPISPPTVAVGSPELPVQTVDTSNMLNKQNETISSS